MGRLAVLWLTVGLWGTCLWHGIPWRARAIQLDLFQRCSAALYAAGLPSAGLSVEGRDVVMSGAKGSPQASDTTVELLSAVRGVRSVRVKLEPESRVVVQARVKVEAAMAEVLAARPVTFARTGAVLSDAGRRTLDEVAALLNQAPTLAVSIEAAARTAELGRRRALSVRQYLIGRGLVASRLSARGRAQGDAVEFHLKEVEER